MIVWECTKFRMTDRLRGIGWSLSSAAALVARRTVSSHAFYDREELNGRLGKQSGNRWQVRVRGESCTELSMNGRTNSLGKSLFTCSGTSSFGVVIGIKVERRAGGRGRLLTNGQHPEIRRSNKTHYQ